MGLFSIFGKDNTLYFPGCVTYFKFKENYELYKKIFSKLGIDFKIIEKNICCGLPAFEAGYEADARKLCRRNLEIFREENIKNIITNSPCCYKMFLKTYPEFLPEWDIKVKNVWEIILKKLKSKHRLIKNKVEEEVTYQDSCYLGRHCNIYNEPREILELIGYKIKEMTDSKEKSICCGSCGGLNITDSELADKIAKERILQAKRIGVKKMIVSSINDYELLKKNSEGTGIEILELSNVLAKALDIELEIKETAEEKESEDKEEESSEDEEDSEEESDDEETEEEVEDALNEDEEDEDSR